MNLQVKDNRKSEYDPEGTVLELVNVMRLVAAIHPDFKEGVCLSIESADCPTTVCIQIESLRIDWLMGLSHAYEDWEMLKGMPIEQACAKIKELTSPRADQPAPGRTAADAKKGDPAWFRYGLSVYHGEIVHVAPNGFVYFLASNYLTTGNWLKSDFGTLWGFIEEQQP